MLPGAKIMNIQRQRPKTRKGIKYRYKKGQRSQEYMERPEQNIVFFY